MVNSATRSTATVDRIVLPDPPAGLAAVVDGGGAVAWREPLTIRTYEPGEPSPYPMYLDQRVYQGSSGQVYPLPFIEQIADEATDREWDAVHVENRYVRLVILPELGGRIHIGYDKTNDYDFFYRNNVIKPALVGLAGPWISGGVEFNWPQHHRPGTYLPVEAVIDEGADGSVTVWCHDHDPFTRMSAHHGVRLRPDSSVVELVVRLHNRTDQRQSFLWWANVAARVHDDYQSFYPEDVRYVADHARRAITAFPAADRPYYNVDYPALAAQHPGADRIDFYRNIPVPTSYMIVDSQQDFFGGYDHAAQAGFVHWAERRVSPGKKQWTWGNAPFGHAWDAQLTDGDGPYVELMAGVYTDNQPDFSWLLPGETKTFSQYWYPIPGIGIAHQASPDAAVHVDRDGLIQAACAVTSPQPGAVIRILRAGAVVASRTVDMIPGRPESLSEHTPAHGDPSVELIDHAGRLLVKWQPTIGADTEPWVAEEPPPPDSLTSVEELYLTGLHLAQYRHPTRSPMAYWNAALAHDPMDARTNLAVADHKYRMGLYEDALVHVERALTRLTRRNANPMDADAFYLAGLILERLGRTTQAEQAFGKAGWDGAWAAAAGLALARSLARRGADRSAMRVLDSLEGVVGHDTRRTALRVILLQRAGRVEEATAALETALRVDPLDATIRVLAGQPITPDAGLLLDIALDLRKAGDKDRASQILARVLSAPVTPAGNFRPMALYSAAEIADEQVATHEANRLRLAAQAEDLTRAFPYGNDALDTLQAAVDADTSDSAARTLLGTALYAHARRAEAATAWNAAIALGKVDAVLFRNAALAAYNISHDDDRAWELYRRAVELAPKDARLRYEHDQLALRLGHTNDKRLARLTGIRDLVLSRDDLTLEFVRLLISEGHPAQAYTILTERTFRPWEGGEGQALAAWDAVHDALQLPKVDPPANLGEARPIYPAPAAVRTDGITDYFATSLPELLLFNRTHEDD